MRFYTRQHRFYCGVDLHARTLSLHVLDDQGDTALAQTLPADPKAFLRALAPYLLLCVIAALVVLATYRFQGLFTWWEDENEGNAYGGWERVRGWVKPPSSQPHYWTAAQMLLLQLDMLALADLTAPAPELVVGAGVPAAWLKRSMSVRGVSTRLGRVDWIWDGREMRVTVAGPKCAVRLGPVFPGGTPLSTTHVRP